MPRGKRHDILLPAALTVLIILLLLLLILQWSEISSLDSQIEQSRQQAESNEASLKAQIQLLNQKVNQKDAEIGNLTLTIGEKDILITGLSQDLNDTEEELNETRAELASKETSLEEAQERFEELKEEIEDAESSLNDTLQWLQENSHMSMQTENFIDYSDRKCVDGNDLNLACVPLFMDMYLDFVYVEEPNDKLNSIDEMIAKGGGDCEDFSLFLKALINDYDVNANLLAWEEGAGRFVIHETDTRQWYYDDAEPVNLGKLKNYHPVVFCYVTQYTFRLEGHCIVALPEKEITDVGELSYLEGAGTFEPQNGRYTGTIGEDFRLCDDSPCGTSPDDSIIVITDSDIYQFIDNEWESIGQQKDNLDALRQALP